MSTLQNEMLLENLFEDAMAELIKQGFDKMFDQKNLEIIAGNLAKEQFETTWQSGTQNPHKGVFSCIFKE